MTVRYLVADHMYWDARDAFKHSLKLYTINVNQNERITKKKMYDLWATITTFSIISLGSVLKRICFFFSYFAEFNFITLSKIIYLFVCNLDKNFLLKEHENAVNANALLNQKKSNQRTWAMFCFIIFIVFLATASHIKLKYKKKRIRIEYHSIEIGTFAIFLLGINKFHS